MQIVFHGSNAGTFRNGIEQLLSEEHCIVQLPDVLEDSAMIEAYRQADVLIGARFNRELPVSDTLRLFHVPGAGYDAIELDALPSTAALCNCFGHENAIAEYVMSALLARHVPLQLADQQLRNRDWHFWAGGPDGLRTELGSQSIGIIGFGHIGKAVAHRAATFGMQVHITNRSAVEPCDIVYKAYALSELQLMLGTVDIVLNTLPLTDSTQGLVGEAELASMQEHAIIMNVGRGAVINEAALYKALRNKVIAGAIIDTWYSYPR